MDEKEKIKRELGKRVKFLLRKRHLNQTQAAKLLGVSQTMISQIINGNQHTSLAMAKKLAEILKVTVPELMGLEELPREIEIVVRVKPGSDEEVILEEAYTQIRRALEEEGKSEK